MKSILPVEEHIKIDAARRAEKERLKQESRERWLKSLEQKKVDEWIIDTEKEITAENLKKMADQVLMAKALEVDSKSASSSESSGKVSSSGSENESGKADCAKTENVCRCCTKECKVCNTHTYLSNKRIQELVEKIGKNDKEILSRDKLVKASSERIKELSEKIEKDKSDVEQNFDKLKRSVKDSDGRNGKTHKENTHLSGVLQAKEKLINQQLDEIANLKLQFLEAKIENERINLKLNSYNSACFVLQHIVPKPIGKNKAGEDVYSDGTGKKSGLANESETSEKTDVEKLLESIDVTFTSQSDEDSIQYEVVKNVVENVLKSDSDSTEEDEYFLNNNIPKLKSQDNLSDESTLVMYKMNGPDKLYSDTEFLIENVNVDKLKKVFKLVEVKELTSSKRFLNLERDKSYYKKPVVPPRFNRNNQNRWSGGYQGGKNYPKRNFQQQKFVEKKVFVKSSSSISEQESEIFSKTNEEFFLLRRPHSRRSKGKFGMLTPVLASNATKLETLHESVPT
ncbi:kinesin-1 heavy chain-like [Helianthus annuus]|uniref:kinesin-1 heavy chain-like n=1 Tax=Helianthus annuus TaxID=4232 RepID=UPI000B8FFFD0|nr:kinesin-1 heavy chain-like [Helianthus annuus]